MFWSRYNEFIDEDISEPGYLYNCFRGKFFKIHPQLKELIKSKDPASIQRYHVTLYTKLVEEHFIVKDLRQEADECMRLLKEKFSKPHFIRITINPTLDCNLRCWYCYEKQQKGSCMSHHTIESVAMYLRDVFSSKNFNGVLISFFGGEPLLKYQDVVSPLLSKAKLLSEEFNKPFSVGFTTNGVCLKKSVVDHLRGFSDNTHIQVAFDGGRDSHNQVKHFPNGKGSYDIVKDNIFYAIEQGLNINVRCNYSLKTIDTFLFLLKDFQKYWEYQNVRFSFFKIWQEKMTDALKVKLNNIKDFIVQNHIKSNVSTFYGDNIYNCYADYSPNIVINYDGNIFKCTARDFVEQNSIGTLEENGQIIFNGNALINFADKLTAQCPQCRVLPICPTCLQHRMESPDKECPDKLFMENASINIKKHFYDLYHFSHQ